MVSSAIQCPEYDHLNVDSTFCGTEHCRGASVFGPRWDEDLKCWEYGASCSCGCADIIYVYGIDDEDWELV